MDLQGEMQNICTEVPGCRAAVLMNLDGLTVTRHVSRDATGKGNLDDETLLVELTSSIRQAIQAVASVQGGALGEFQIHFDRGSVVIRLLPDEHFIAMLLEPNGLAGKSRFVLRSHSRPLTQELF